MRYDFNQEATTATSEVAREMRQRRLAWARGGAATRPDTPHAPAYLASTSRTHDQSGRGQRAWSLRVEVIERERLLRGWTQRELARRSHVDPGTLCSLLAQRRRPTLGTVQALCTPLGLSLADVLAFAREAV